MAPWLTVAMATHTDFYGVDATLFGLKMYHDLTGVEILVLDNAPDNPEGKEVKSLCQNAGVRYETFTDSQGTTQTREKLFELANGELVLVMDCHVFLQAGAIAKLREFWTNASEDDKKLLYTGPLLYDNLVNTSTHFECEWRDGMLGVWATAWRNKEGQLMVGKSIDNTLHMKVLNTKGPWMKSDVPWGGHEKVLLERGWTVAGYSDDIAFEVPAQGLGMFLSSKKEWLGFNPNFRNFGGEECYIHEKYLQAGRKTVCLPFMKWRHRFGRPGGPKYPLSTEAKIRNYLLGHMELGLPVSDVENHFVGTLGVPKTLYDVIAADPLSFNPMANPARQVRQEAMTPKMTSNLGMPLPLADDLPSIAKFIASVPRDLDQHGETLMKYASDCQSVGEITMRRESTAFLLAGLEKKCENCNQCTGACKTTVQMHSFQVERDNLIESLKEGVKNSQGRPISYSDTPITPDALTPDMPPVDMLFLDTSDSDVLKQQLDKYAANVARYIVMHDTAVHAEKDNKGGQGLVATIRLWLKDNKDWFVHYHTDAQYGLTTLCRLPELNQGVQPWPAMYADGSPCGVGQEIKGWLAKIGITASNDCPCNALAKKYNAAGPDWCRLNIEEILDKLKEQADARKLGYLFVRPVVKLAVFRMIRDVEKKIKTGVCF